MGERDEDIFDQLQHLNDQIRQIVDGQCEPPTGISQSGNRVLATTDDVYRMLENVVGLLERQNRMIDAMGRLTLELSESPNEDRWDQLIEG
jgi:hypothetical protein